MFYLLFLLMSHSKEGKKKKRIKWSLKLNICSAQWGLQKEKMWVRWIAKETERVQNSVRYLLNAAFVKTGGSEKEWKLQCSVYPKIKYWIGQASTMQSSLPFTVSALTWNDNSLMCWKHLRLPSQAGTDSFPKARNKMDFQKLITTQFRKNLSTPVTPFILKARHSYSLVN